MACVRLASLVTAPSTSKVYNLPSTDETSLGDKGIVGCGYLTSHVLADHTSCHSNYSVLPLPIHSSCCKGGLIHRPCGQDSLRLNKVKLDLYPSYM